MQSLSKTPVQRDTAQAIIHEIFGAGAALTGFEELTEGFFNAAYLLTVGGGAAGSYVLKVAPPETVPV